MQLFTRFDNKGQEIKHDDIYHIEFDGNRATLRIINPTLENAGLYKIQGISERAQPTANCPQVVELTLTLNVFGTLTKIIDCQRTVKFIFFTETPTVCLGSEDQCQSTTPLTSFYLTGEDVEVECAVKGNPKPVITWEELTCSKNNICNFTVVITD